MGVGSVSRTDTFGPSAQSITFTGNGANSVTVVSQQLTGLALDTINGAVGTLSLSPLSFIAGPQSGGLFPAGSNTETFTYSNPDGDMLTETWQILVIQDNTPQPKFFGTGTVTKSVSGVIPSDESADADLPTGWDGSDNGCGYTQRICAERDFI